MSFDGGSKIDIPGMPMANAEPPKSRKKLWIFGGLGCFGLIGLICVGGIASAYFLIWIPMMEFQSQCIAEATSLPQVVDALGTPVTEGTTPPPVQDGQKFTFRTPLSGPNGEGTLVFKGSPDGTGWKRDEMYFEFNGEQIDLDTDLLFDLDINEGQ